MKFFDNFGKEPNLFKKLRNNKLIYLIIKKMNVLKQIHKNIIKIS